MNLDIPLYAPPPPPEAVLTLMLFKLFFLISAGLYIAVAFVIVRQIAVMKKTLMTPTTPTLTILGYVHLAIAIGVFLLFWVML